MPVVFILFKWLIILNLNVTLPRFQQAVPVINSKASLHPYYISVTEIEYNNKQKAIEISCKLFADDLELALKQEYEKSIDLSAPAAKTENKSIIKEYILKRLSFELDGKMVAPQFLGLEKEGEAVYLYFEALGINSFKKLNLQNSILQDYTNEQINIVHVIVNGKRQSTKMTHTVSKGSFAF